MPQMNDKWIHPSVYQEYKVVCLINELTIKYPQTKIDGIRNVWITKPSFCSRGIGIHCLNTLKEALAAGKKVQAKVIQKYVEDIFLLEVEGANGKLEAKKFDIRQWVLVTSFDPLQIYMFDSCYLRLCGNEFSLDNIKDNFAHISNYSIQRKNLNVENTKHDLTMSLPQFLLYLKAHNMYSLIIESRDKCWKSDVWSKMKEIINETMITASESIEQRSNSFELYGFDFVLDKELKPWLIEVNSSPACSNRTQWLSQMLGKSFNRGR